ncbi:MAG: hypothetical protein ACFFD4_01880 [Candidatus Odinarchaeota archaeon]
MIETRKLLTIILLTSLFWNSSLFEVTVVDGSSPGIQTSLSVWPGDYQYLEGESIEVEVCIWDINGQAVETGMITVDDLNGSTVVQASIFSYLTSISWTAVLNGLPGIHLFEVTYEDPNDQYLSSVSIFELLLGRDITAGETGMEIVLDAPSYSAVKGQGAILSGNLLTSGAVFPYFYIDPESACLKVEAEIDGTWKILNMIYPVTEITSGYEIEVAFSLPPWLVTGPVAARCVFSGSYSSDLDTTTAFFTINLLSQEKSIVLLAEQLTVERSSLIEQNVFTVGVQVPGYDSDPVTVDIDLLAENGSLEANLLVDYLLTGYSSQLLLEIPQGIKVSTYTLLANLIDQQTSAVLASDSTSVTVTDDLLVDNFYWNVTDQLVIAPGQHIQGYLVSREEDTFLAVKANLLVRLASTGEVLFAGVTGDSGYIQFIFDIPEDLLPGIHNVEFMLSPLPADQYHQEVIKTISVTILQETTIIHQKSPFLVRGQEGWFNATVVDESGVPVNTGTLYLTLNGETLFTEDDSTASFRYVPKASIPRGINVFAWHYSGSGIYKMNEKSFPVPVYSVPTFTNLSSSIVEAFPGDMIEIRGNLVEETGTGISGAPVNVIHRDNWNNINSQTLVTDEKGLFIFEFSPEDENSGIHFFTVEFGGWSEEYYLPIPGALVFEISVNPPLSLSVNGELVAGENVTLEFHGKSGQEITLEILENANWCEIETFILDNEGNYDYHWIPAEYLRGEVFLRASYNGGAGMAIFSVTIKVKPRLDIQVPNSPVMIGEDAVIVVSCSENHGIWLDGELWAVGLSPGSRQYKLVFTEAADHYLEVITSGVDVVETVLAATLQIRMDYSVEVSIPTRVQRSTDVAVIVTTRDSSEQPLEGFTAELFLNGTLMASAMTSPAGNAVMNLSLLTGFYVATVMITSRDQYVYVSKEIELDGLTVYSIPKIELSGVKPVKGQIVDVGISITDGTDPVSGETVFLYLTDFTGDIDDVIGSNVTDDNGYTGIKWNVTQKSGDYLLQVKNQGNRFLEPILLTKPVHVLEEGPQFVQATVSVIKDDQNLYLVTAALIFPGGKGSVYLHKARTGYKLGELQEESSFWTLKVQLEEGTHDLWLQAVDAAGVDSWYDLGTVKVLNDRLNEPSNDEKADGNPLSSAVRDTLLSAMFLFPVAGIIVYKKRKGLIKT